MHKQQNTPTTISEIIVTYQPAVKLSLLPIIKTAEHAYLLFLGNWDKSKLEFIEEFKIMLLNRSNRVLGICVLTSGCTTGTIADPKQVFSIALKTNATNIILAHNHPSGSLTPSQADRDLTKKMKAAGDYLDLKVIDHIIVTGEAYYSFAEEGVL